MQQGNSIVVIGAGILGLSVACDLSRRGHPVIVLEKGPSAGGLAAPRTLDNGARLEKFYHHFFAGQQHLLETLRELDLEDDLSWTETRMAFFCEGRLHPFNGPRDVLTFGPLKLADRARFGLGALLLGHTPAGQGRRPAIEWLRAVCGRAATRAIWQPLLQMKFGSAYDTVAIGWLKNRVRDRQRGRSGAGRERLGYVNGSIGAIIDAQAAAIESLGNTIRFGCQVERLEVAQNQVRAVHVDGGRIEPAAVVATVPNPVFCRLVPELPAEILDPLAAIRYQGSICITVMSTKPFTDYYWINVVDPALPFVVAVEHTNFMEPDSYGGHVIYLGKYVERDAPEWEMTDSELIESFLQGLEELSPGFRRSDLLNAWVSKDPLTQPVFGKSYSKPRMDTGVDNLFLANTSMLFPESRTVDSSIGLAKEVNRLVLKSLAEA